jgi:hypothetical protein
MNLTVQSTGEEETTDPRKTGNLATSQDWTMRQELADRIKDLSREWKKARAAKDEAKTDTEESDSSEIEYVDLAPASPAQGKGKTGKGGTTKKPKLSRLRG